MARPFFFLRRRVRLGHESAYFQRHSLGLIPDKCDGVVLAFADAHAAAHALIVDDPIQVIDHFQRAKLAVFVSVTAAHAQVRIHL